jgi:hypothetical protein
MGNCDSFDGKGVTLFCQDCMNITKAVKIDSILGTMK